MILTIPSTLEEHLDQKGFYRLREHELKMKFKKCQLIKKDKLFRVSY